MDLMEHIHLEQHKKVDLTWMGVSHGAILLRLYVFGELSMSEIATKISRTAPTTTVLVKKLKEHGMLDSRKSLVDERKSILTLTPKGIEYCLVTERYLEKLYTGLEKGVSHEEVQCAIGVLRRVKANGSEIVEKQGI